MSSALWDVAKKLIPPSSLATVWAFGTKATRKRRERVVLDMLEHAEGPLSVSTMHNELLGKTLRGIPLRYVLPTLKPGGDMFNEDDQIPAKTPLPIRIKYWFRIFIKRELPTEQTLTDTLRELRERGHVEHVFGDSWRIARKD